MAQRALRAGFDPLTAINQMNGLTLCCLMLESAPNLLMLSSQTPRILRWHYQQALAQTAHQEMPSHHGNGTQHSQPTQYSEFAMSVVKYSARSTDRELVIFRRADDNGNLEVVPPIPFTSGGTAEHPQMTVLLALWYLGMHAAQDGHGNWHM
ncbi:uncharacterized protein PADG_00277 [Paracoccidioides brasiliensis Pb18]|uniref:Uncharacterized protein n=1 Tax=Paracoccidioides brasiliensis (strain Pb18) TaxID=502780 RepID=C1G087_PARBD|nr:uncharacterized protein PADG_00277 [Paracoccidioides brasiliensis Pb18]EEH43988.2 hypothetical protein PADG_00277 [Paracoccidioides brasiliensis Pb18]